MTIDWVNFSPWSSLAGGALIGLAASLLVIGNGRIAGISGVLGGLLGGLREGRGERALFILGVLLAPVLWGLLTYLPTVEFQTGWLGLLLAGLLVGVGTRYGSGCTSGHGVCGLSQFSGRSLAATLAFMLGGFASVYAVRHLWGG